jgi:hypothetical protein
MDQVRRKAKERIEKQKENMMLQLKKEPLRK